MLSLPPALRQSLVYGMALATTKAISLLMAPIFTHFLEPADYGRLDILQTLADLLSIVIGFGLADTLYRFAGSTNDKDEQQTEAANVIGFSLIVGLLTLLSTQLAAPWISSHLPGDITIVQTRLILGTLAMSGISLILLSWLRMQEKAVLYVTGSLGRVVLQASGAAAFLMYGFGITGVLIAGLFAATVMCVGLLTWCLRTTGILFKASRYKTYLIYGGPLILTGMAGFILGSFDRWILADEIGPAAMAEYALAAKIALMTAFAIQPFDLWWLPNRFKILGQLDGKKKCARAVGIGVTVAVFSAVGIAIVGPAVIRLVTPETYHGAVVYVPWLAALAAIHAITTMVNLGAMSGRTTLRLFAIEGSAATLAVIGYFTLIPLYGGYGAIAATAVALTSRLVVTYWISQKCLYIPHQLSRLSGIVTIGIGIVVFLPSGDGIIAPALWAMLSGALVMVFAMMIKLMPNPLSVSR